MTLSYLRSKKYMPIYVIKMVEDEKFIALLRVDA